MAFRTVNQVIGSQAIAETSDTQKHPLGTIVRAADPDRGAGEFIYLKGAASTTVGSWVTYLPDDYTTALLLAGAVGSVAVAMSANAANSYGWYMVKGKPSGKALAGYADNADVYATSTAGSVDDAVVVGDLVYGARGASAVSGGVADFEIDNPYVNNDDAGLVGFSHAATYSAGTLSKKLQQFFNPMDAPYSAAGDGSADDYAAFIAADAAAAAAGSALIITETHRLNTSYTPTADLVFIGGKIKPASGTTFTVNKGIGSFGAVQIFDISLGGTVNLNDAKIGNGYFEWFGVVADSAGAATNNTTYMNAAIVATPSIVATAADYYHSGTVKVLTPNHELIGRSSLYDATYGLHATRFLVTNGSSHTLQIGSDSDPGGIAVLPQGIKVSGIQAARTVAPVAASGCTSVRVQYLSKSHIADVRGDESMIGWEFNGCVAVKVANCWAKRTSAGTGGADSWKGFYVNGGSGIAAGGNASLRIIGSHADDTRAVKTNSTGFLADQKFTDCFWVDCETSQCTTGMEVQGNDAVTNDLGNTDMTIIHPVNDAFATYGLWVHKLGTGGSVDISQPYCGPAAGATAAIQISDNKGGSVTISGGQLVMGSAPACVPVKIDALGDSSGGGSLIGTVITESGAGGVVMSNATNWRIEPIIQNDVVTGGAAVQLVDACAANYIAPIVKGKASGSSLGIQVVGTTDVRNEYNCTGIDSSTIAGGAANKLVRNAVQVTVTGLTGTNLASGVMT